MRYLAEHIDTSTGRARLGSAHVLVRHYSSDRNAFRYMHRHLAAGVWPAGQYRLSAWPETAGGAGEREVGYLYKLAS